MEENKNNFIKIALALLVGVGLGYFIFSGNASIKNDNLRLPWRTAQFDDGGNYFEGTSQDYINALGSWISDSDNGIISEQPFNTTEISCYKSRGFCTEARAYKMTDGTGNLLVQILEYEIKSWTSQEIVAIFGGRAANVEIHFDRVKKVVTMIESEKAEIEGARTLPAYAHLGGGQEAIDASRK